MKGRGGRTAYPALAWRPGVSAGKCRIQGKTSIERVQEKGGAALLEAGTTMRGGCMSVVIRKLCRAQGGCLIC